LFSCLPISIPILVYSWHEFDWSEFLEFIIQSWRLVSSIKTQQNHQSVNRSTISTIGCSGFGSKKSRIHRERCEKMAALHAADKRFWNVKFSFFKFESTSRSLLRELSTAGRLHHHPSVLHYSLTVILTEWAESSGTPTTDDPFMQNTSANINSPDSSSFSPGFVTSWVDVD